MAAEFEARVKEIIQRTYNVKSVRLDIPNFKPYEAGQFLSVTLNNDPKLKRYLSISSSPTEKCYIEFTKKITSSDFSKRINMLKAGDIVKVQYPLGKFILQSNDKNIAFISGGIGITPIRSIAKYVVDSNLGVDMVLLYANRTVRDVVFKEDFDAMQAKYPKFKVTHVLCEPEPNFKCTTGLINAQIIKNEISDYRERKFFLCGPPQMVEAMKNILKNELSLAENSIILENFQGY